MAIKLPDGRIMRTLPEQVDKNMQDIASINNEVNVIKESITTAYKIQGSATVADLNANTPDAAMNGYVYNMTDAGYLINSDESTTSVQIGDNVVLVWNEGNYFWDRLSGVVDTSNLVTLDSDQEITGSKTFKNANGIYLINETDNSKWQIHTEPYLFYIKDNLSRVRLYSDWNTFVTNGTIRPFIDANFDLGTTNIKWKDLYLSDYAEFKNPNAGRYWRITVDAAQNLIIQSSTNRNSWSNECFWNSNGDLNLLSNDLIIAGNIKDSSSNSVTVAQISKTKLYKHQMTVSNVTGPVNVILTNNTPITGSFGANMSSQVVIAAYLTAQSNASQMKTPNGGLAQINSDGTITITVSSGETITADTVTEL